MAKAHCLIFKRLRKFNEKFNFSKIVILSANTILIKEILYTSHVELQSLLIEITARHILSGKTIVNSNFNFMKPLIFATTHRLERDISIIYNVILIQIKTFF